MENREDWERLREGILALEEDGGWIKEEDDLKTEERDEICEEMGKEESMADGGSMTTKDDKHMELEETNDDGGVLEDGEKEDEACEQRDGDGVGTHSPERKDGSEKDGGGVPSIKDAKRNGARMTGVRNDRVEGNSTMGLAKYSRERGEIRREGERMTGRMRTGKEHGDWGWSQES